MIKQNKALRSAIRESNADKVKEILINQYSFSDIVSALSDYLITPPVFAPQKYKILKSDFEKYFQIYEKRTYNKGANSTQSVKKAKATKTAK